MVMRVGLGVGEGGMNSAGRMLGRGVKRVEFQIDLARIDDVMPVTSVICLLLILRQDRGDAAHLTACGMPRTVPSFGQSAASVNCAAVHLRRGG